MKLGTAAAVTAALGLAFASSAALAEGHEEQCFDKGTLTYFDCAPAEEFDHWMIRLRAIAVVPDEDEKFDGGLIGTELDISDAYVPELDITYFFNENIALELILATAPHDVETTTGTDLGSVWLLPPTLTLQYHLTMFDGFKPYIGAGVNYTFFYGVDEGPGLNVNYEDTFGLALQAGVDIEIADGWYLNADVKKIFLNPDIEVYTNAGAFVDSGEVDIDPWIFGAGFGYRF